MEYLDLKMSNDRPLAINPLYFKEIWEELENFLEDEVGSYDLDFVKRILFNLEIKSNNTIEGIIDDLDFIEKVIKNAESIHDNEKRKRVINLYKAYKFILRNKIMDERHLIRLYGILSDGLLEERDLNRMGNIYREAPVYILNRGRLDQEPDMGMPHELIQSYMDNYFKFINTSSNGTITEEFIKSQIMHFYFVFVHPFFDVNGRTSRTMAMWYLLNKKAYPYIIFNRGLNFGGGAYDDVISKCKRLGNVSEFIKFMMENVKKELEKEMIMKEIKYNTSADMTAMDFQTLHYILSMNGEINVLTYATTYRDKNDRKSVRGIYEDSLRPLIDKGILQVERTTQKNMFGDYKNEVLRLNPDKYDQDNPKIKRLNLEFK